MVIYSNTLMKHMKCVTNMNPTVTQNNVTIKVLQQKYTCELPIPKLQGRRTVCRVSS